jgi:16S rRNA (guanine527-N7)-methyltransferase
VTSREFNERLSRRASKARVQFPSDVVAPLEAYFRLLAQWNVKINLTALPLNPPTDETFDRLFIEPLVAAPLVATEPGVWFDLGSGGGSPAFPLKLVRPELALTLVESKTRKAAFLREVIRALQLPSSDVANVRFEDFANSDAKSADLVTARAIRPDRVFFKTAAELTRVGGRLLVFGTTVTHSQPIGFARESLGSATEAPSRLLKSYVRVFHVEQQQSR